jgi:hypothetical protein
VIAALGNTPARLYQLYLILKPQYESHLEQKIRYGMWKAMEKRVRAVRVPEEGHDCVLQKHARQHRQWLLDLHSPKQQVQTAGLLMVTHMLCTCFHTTVQQQGPQGVGWRGSKADREDGGGSGCGSESASGASVCVGLRLR